MSDLKTVIGIIAVIISIAGYIPYIREVIQGKTIPHVFTWFVWTLGAAIAWALQVSGGAGVGSWVAFSIMVMSAFIFIVGLRHGNKDITLSDTLFLISSLFALGLWLVAKQPMLSIILVVSTDLLAFVPTIRKTWKKPYSESLLSYKLNSLGHGVNLLALQQYSIVTLFYPVVWASSNALFAVMLILRRRMTDR